MRARLGIIAQLFRFLREQRLWWMMPLVAVLLVVGMLLLIAIQTPAGPFIYTLF